MQGKIQSGQTGTDFRNALERHRLKQGKCSHSKNLPFFLKIPEFTAQTVECVSYGGNTGVKKLSGRQQAQRVSGFAFEERNAELFLQFLYLLTHGGGGQAENGGSPAYAAGFGDIVKGAQVLDEIHVYIVHGNFRFTQQALYRDRLSGRSSIVREYLQALEHSGTTCKRSLSCDSLAMPEGND